MADIRHDYYGGPGLPELPMQQGGSQTTSEDESGDDQVSKKRKRPVNVTCEQCKQRKVRCDRARPSCGWCSRNDHVCEYKERKKPGLRAGYGRELEGRLDRLEQLLGEQGRQLAAHLAEACTTGGVSSSTTRHQQRERLSYDGDAEQYDAEGPMQQQMIDPNLRLTVSRQGSLQYAHVQGEQHAQTQNQYTPTAQSHGLRSPLSAATYQPAIYSEPTSNLPPYDLLYTLVDLYFKHTNSWLPLLDRKTTLERLFGSTPLEEADRVLLHAIVAAALRFSQDPRLNVETRQHYHETSKQRVQLFGLENSSVRSLQALVILALDVTGNTNGPPGWNLLALISRSVVQLGLAVETTSSLAAPPYPSIATLRAAMLPDAKTWIEDEERRRLFWSVYLLDRYATIATAFEFALDEKEADRRVPCRDDLFAANSPVETRWFRGSEGAKYSSSVADSHGHFAYHCELVGILGSIHQFLKRPIDIGSLSDVEQWQASYKALDGELNAWHFGLPDEFANIGRLMKANIPAKSASSGWVMLHAAYCLTVIRLNSSAAYPSQTSRIFPASYSAMQRCMGAVANMRQLAHLVRISSLVDKLGPPFAFSTWVCARVTLVHGSTMDHEVDPEIDFFVSILSEMGQHWDVAKRYSEILSRVLGEYRQSQRSVGVTGERITPSTVKILADMRRLVTSLYFLRCFY